MNKSSERPTQEDPSREAAVFAIVEQMGHRRFGARVREVTRFGAACMEATVLSDPPVVTLVMPASIFAVTFCTEAQARAANLRHTGLPGLGARPMDPAWADAIVEQCEAAGVAAFTKQIATPQARRAGDRKGKNPELWPSPRTGAAAGGSHGSAGDFDARAIFAREGVDVPISGH